MAEQLLPENCPNQAWQYLTEQYQRHDHGHYTVTTECLSHLLMSEKILHAMMQKGVHNLEYFEEAMMLAQQEEEE